MSRVAHAQASGTHHQSHEGHHEVQVMEVEESKSRKSAAASYMRYLSLALLAVQNATQMLLMRSSRLKTDDGNRRYIASTAVIMQEMIKTAVSLVMMLVLDGNTVAQASRELRRVSIDNPGDSLRLCVPGLLYTVQNNLLYVATTNLDAATASVLYQLKSLTTAILSVLMLNRSLSRQQWGALVVLAIGAGCVQHSTVSGAPTTGPEDDGDASPVVGFMAVLAACTTSGFSGVYFERIVKQKDKGLAQASLWVRNVQLGTFGIIFGVAAMIVQDFSAVRELGFFHGYSSLVWGVILTVSCGGLLVAIVVKYADSIAKSFATSIAILLSTAVSAALLHFTPSLEFLAGAALVLCATIAYATQ